MSDELERRLQDLLEERGSVASSTHRRVVDSIGALPDQRRRAPATRLLAVAVIALTLVALTGVYVTQRPPDVLAPSPEPTASPSVDEPSASPSPTLQSRPVWARELASHLDCDGAVATMGMDVPESPDPLEPGISPDEALDNFLIDYPSLRRSLFGDAYVVGHWALHRYVANGRAKVHIVSTNQFPEVPDETRWQVVGMRACDQSEYDIGDIRPGRGTVWRGADGRPATTDIVYSEKGPGHCGWDQTVFLTLGPDGIQYIRDPLGDLADETVMAFDPDVALPDDAIDTSLRNDKWHLFTVPSGSAVFMRTGDGTYERWPRAREPIGCA